MTTGACGAGAALRLKNTDCITSAAEDLQTHKRPFTIIKHSAAPLYTVRTKCKSPSRRSSLCHHLHTTFINQRVSNIYKIVLITQKHYKESVGRLVKVAATHARSNTQPQATQLITASANEVKRHQKQYHKNATASNTRQIFLKPR